MFSSLFIKLGEMIQKMLGIKNVENALNIVPAISTQMVDAIELWTYMYENKSPWLHEPTSKDPVMIVSLGLPSFIASEKARMATLELKSEIKAPVESTQIENPNYEPMKTDSFGRIQISSEPKVITVDKQTGPKERAEYLNKQYHDKLLRKIRTQLEYGVAKGSLIIKPYVVKKQLGEIAGVEKDAEEVFDIDFDFIQADCFYPFAFDSSGNLSEVAFVQTKTEKDTTYTRLEYHKLEGSKVTILNTAYEKNANQTDTVGIRATLGKEIPLTKVYEWKDIPPKAIVKNVDRLLFGYFKMPEANVIDPHSPLGVSGYARAKNLIREADKQFSRLLWEYEGGELAIDIDRDALRQQKDINGEYHYVNNKLQERLYRQVDVDINGETYKPYNPQLRDSSYIQGLNDILMRIEDVCALSRGTLSDVGQEAKTATELKILKQRSYASNLEIQHALELALRDVIYTMDVYCTIYNIVGDAPVGEDGLVDTSKVGKFDVSFEWDDSILVDAELELNKRLLLMKNGLASKVETRMWYYGESEAQARDSLKKVNDETLQAIENNMIASSQMGKAVQQNQGNNQDDNQKDNTSGNISQGQASDDTTSSQNATNTQQNQQKDEQ